MNTLFEKIAWWFKAKTGLYATKKQIILLLILGCSILLLLISLIRYAVFVS